MNSRILSVEICLLALFPEARGNKFISKKGEIRTSYQTLQLVLLWHGELYLCCFLFQTYLFCTISVFLTPLLKYKRNIFLCEASLLFWRGTLNLISIILFRMHQNCLFNFCISNCYLRRGTIYNCYNTINIMTPAKKTLIKQCHTGIYCFI